MDDKIKEKKENVDLLREESDSFEKEKMNIANEIKQILNSIREENLHLEKVIYIIILPIYNFYTTNLNFAI